MVTFWIIAALLILLAFWFLLPALVQRSNQSEEEMRREANIMVYKDQHRELDADLKTGLIGEQQYHDEKAELERRMLEDVTTQSDIDSAAAPLTNKYAYGVAAFIPVAAVTFYLFVGNPKAIDSVNAPATTPAATAQPQPGMMSPQQIAANTDKLAERLKQNPNDPQGWRMLGRSYLMQEKFSDAASAFQKLTELSPNDADAWADYAEATAIANGQNLTGKPTEAINRALQINPQHQKSLDLAGTAAYQSGDYQKAIDYWERLLKVLPPGSQGLRMVTEQITKAKEMAAGKK
jgi:cytochrome c-type biogenesis protein CcmH